MLYEWKLYVCGVALLYRARHVSCARNGRGWHAGTRIGLSPAFEHYAVLAPLALHGLALAARCLAAIHCNLCRRRAVCDLWASDLMSRQLFSRLRMHALVLPLAALAALSRLIPSGCGSTRIFGFQVISQLRGSQHLLRSLA